MVCEVPVQLLISYSCDIRDKYLRKIKTSGRSFKFINLLPSTSLLAILHNEFHDMYSLIPH